MATKTTKLVREGNYAAEVSVELIEDDTAWSPYLSLEDTMKLDAVRVALRSGDLESASKYGRVLEQSADETSDKPKPNKLIWLSATLADAVNVDFEAPIKKAKTADTHELSDIFQKAIRVTDQTPGRPIDASDRVFSMLSAATGMHFTPEHRNEPFSPMAVLSDGRRSPAPEDFRGAPLDVLANMAERATNSVLRARLSDLVWLLDRKRGNLGSLALTSYVEVIRNVDDAKLKYRFEDNSNVLTHDTRDYLRRALQIGRTIGWDKSETLAARKLSAELRVRANSKKQPVPIHWFSQLDLDFNVSDPAEVAAGIHAVLKEKLQADAHNLTDLWKLTAYAYRLAKNDDEANRCQIAAVETMVAEAEATLAHSAMLASHNLSSALADLHGIPGVRQRRTELRHRLIDIQANIPEEMSSFSHEMDLRPLMEEVEKGLKRFGFVDKILAFASIARSPEPEQLAQEALKSIREHPLSSIFGATHHDREGKVIHRIEGGLFGDQANDPAVQQQIAQAESIRRNLVSAEVDFARRIINEQHYVADDVLVRLLRYSAFIPVDLLRTFAKGITRFLRGDYASAIYILTPLLESSLRYVLKNYGHDVTIFDDANQTQMDRTISSLFEQMRTELDAVFTKAITTDIENVFLKRPGPNLRNSLAHGLLHDGDPYGPDAVYGCWLITRLSLLPLTPYREKIKSDFTALN